MKFKPPAALFDRQCSHVIQPGEFMIDTWDNKRCEEKRHTVECLICHQWFCLLFHWHNHSMEHVT